MITTTKPDLPRLEDYVAYLEKIWASRWITNDGEFVQLLTRKLEEYLNVRNLVLVNNGTSALQIAVRALELTGEVVTTPFTFAATTNALIWGGLTPVFADIDPHTYNVDPAAVKTKITERTSAILAVHVYGNPCCIDELRELADEFNLRLIFDAAQAFGVEYRNKTVLDYGDVSTLSFHATKVYTTIEGGAIIVKNPEVCEKARLLRNHGIKSEGEVVVPGTNAKMNEFQAVMGLCNLDKTRANIEARKERYERYTEKIGSSDRPNNHIQFQKIVASKYNYSYMPVLFPNARHLKKARATLIQHGVEPRRYFYPITADFGYVSKNKIGSMQTTDLKCARSISRRMLCLPLYSDLPLETVDEISNLLCVS